MKKEGTPTMGGVAFIVAVFVSFFVIISFEGVENTAFLPIFNLLFFAFLNAIIGFIDDFLKVRKKQNKGLRALSKFSLQSASAISFLVLMEKTVELTTVLKIPFTNIGFDIGFFYYIFAYFLLCGFVNAVNLTDGLDGLASCVMLPFAVMISVLGLIFFDNLLFVFVGALLLGIISAFLIFNRYPAKIFMGDTGSLFLGGILAGFSLCTENALTVVLFGFVYLCEAISVIIQVGYFKISKGKRIFKMAPLHHHFEKSGWSENKIVIIFTLVNTFTCILAFLDMVL